MFRTILAGSAALSLAAALPQNIDFAAVKAAAKPAVQGPAVTAVNETPSYVPSAAASSAAAAVSTDPVTANEKRDLHVRTACAPQPSGAGPQVTPDTPDAFVQSSEIYDIAESAVVPQGYTLAFSNLDGSTSQNGYLGLYTLDSFDTIACQQKCDEATACTAFNLYFERDPSVDPGAGCDNPPSTTNIKCTLWGLPVTAQTATNQGQWRDAFNVVLAGSNGYVKNAAPPSYDSFTGPQELGGAINAPSGSNTYLGMRMFEGPYDPSQCASVCLATTQYDSNHPGPDGTYMPCNFFNSYVLSENNTPLGTYCSMYSQAYGRPYDTNYGQYDDEGNYYSVSSSYGYTLTNQDSGVAPSA